MDLNEAYSLMLPSEPSRGQSTRLVYDESERQRVSSPAAALPLPPAVIPPQTQQKKAAPPPDKYREARKIALYAFIIALGLALHFTASDWLTRYLSKAYLSDTSEQIAKVCYPASVAACIWIIKSWK